MSRQTRYNALIKSYGFLPAEARTLAHTSRRGLNAPYMKRFLNSRRALKLNADRYGWTDEQYRDAIKKQYGERGALKQDILGRIKIDVWKMVRFYEERAPIGEKYESPWRKKIQTRGKTKREMKSATRRQLITDWIAQLNRTLKRDDLTDFRRTQMTGQRDRLQKQLDGLK